MPKKDRRKNLDKRTIFMKLAKIGKDNKSLYILFDERSTSIAFAKIFNNDACEQKITKELLLDIHHHPEDLTIIKIDNISHFDEIQNKYKEMSTNEARRYLMNQLNTCVSPDISFVKKYFSLIHGENKKGSPKIWLRNHIPINESAPS